MRISERTVSVPGQDITVSVLTNAADGLSHGWLEGVLHILRTYAPRGAPARKEAAWTGRWCIAKELAQHYTPVSTA